MLGGGMSPRLGLALLLLGYLAVVRLVQVLQRVGGVLVVQVPNVLVVALAGLQPPQGILGTATAVGLHRAMDAVVARHVLRAAAEDELHALAERGDAVVVVPGPVDVLAHFGVLVAGVGLSWSVDDERSRSRTKEEREDTH